MSISRRSLAGRMTPLPVCFPWITGKDNLVNRPSCLALACARGRTTDYYRLERNVEHAGVRECELDIDVHSHVEPPVAFVVGATYTQ